MKPDLKNHVCDVCGKSGTKMRRVARSYGRGSDLLVIENIPAVNCPHCGQSYFTAEVMRQVEKIKLHRRGLAVRRPVAVAAYA